MKTAWACVTSGVLLLAGCGHAPTSQPAEPTVSGPSNEQLARFLPVLADYPGPSWNVTLTIGASDPVPGPYLDPTSTVDPAECADIPFQRSDLVAASSDGIVQNGIAGDSGEAAVRIMRERPGTDLITESVSWAKRCHEYRVMLSSSTPGEPAGSNPTAVSALPPVHVNGIEVTRIHITDNREHRYQGEGTRESVISLARVGGLVVVGYRHDRSDEAAAILALTIDRLSSNKPLPKPLSDKVTVTPLITRTDKELQRLLPSAQDVPAGWSVLQRSPIIRDGTEDGEDPSGCMRFPFDNRVGWRSDLHRNFREIASVSEQRTVNERIDRDTVTLAIENPGASVIEETSKWAKECGHKIETSEQLAGISTTSVHIKGSLKSKIDYTASLMRVRGLLVVTTPAMELQGSQLTRQTVDNLRHAQFDTPPTGPDPMPQFPDPYARPPGDVKLPAPTAEATAKLTRVGQGALVDTVPYHVGGYLPSDSPTRSSDDYLHFSSPSGAISCTWRKYSLFCEVPQGTYPRTPKPAELQGGWQDSVVSFGWGGLQNGVSADDPIVYAVSNELPYGNTIRLQDGTECLMQTDGLTCVDYGKRIGFHLSRDDLTPLTATGALANDTRPQPN